MFPQVLERLTCEAKRIGTGRLVQTICSLSRAALKHGDSNRCFVWAHEANRLAPWNPHTWEKLIDALLLKDEKETALNKAWVAYDQFPLEPRIQLVLLEALTFSKRDEANYLKRRLFISFADDFERAFETKINWLKRTKISEKPIKSLNISFGPAALGEFRFLQGMYSAGKAQNVLSRIVLLNNLLDKNEGKNDQAFALRENWKLLSNDVSMESATEALKSRLESRPSSLPLWIHYGTLIHKQAIGLHWDKAQQYLKAAPWHDQSQSSRIYPMVPLIEGFTALVAVDGQPRVDFAAIQLGQVLKNSVLRNSLLDEPNENYRADLAGWAAGSLKELLGYSISTQLDGTSAVNNFDKMNQESQRPIILRMPQLILELGSSMSPAVKEIRFGHFADAD